jgi:hypothetical protein
MKAFLQAGSRHYLRERDWWKVVESELTQVKRNE